LKQIGHSSSSPPFSTNCAKSFATGGERETRWSVRRKDGIVMRPLRGGSFDELCPNGAGDSGSSRTRRSRQQTRDRIAELFLRGDTQGNAPGSKWAAVNAIVEYGDWIRPLRPNGRRFARVLDDGPEKTRALQLVAAA
jgi:hypothetical protein